MVIRNIIYTFVVLLTLKLKIMTENAIEKQKDALYKAKLLKIETKILKLELELLKRKLIKMGV